MTLKYSKISLWLIISAISVFLSCKNNSTEAPHEHGPDPLAYTLYSEKSELFVEFQPLVVGNPTKFAAHFTVLGDKFKALSEGKVTVSLIVNRKGIRQTANTPSTPGIYRLALTPVVSGKGKLVFDIVTKDFTDQVVINDVTIFDDKKSALAYQESLGGANPNDIKYLKEQAWRVDFANESAQMKPFSEVIKTTGTLENLPIDEEVLSSQISGVVTYVGNKQLIGNFVNAGTTLFSIKNNEVVSSSLNSAVQQAENDLNIAKKQYERATDLVKDKIVSEKDYLETKLRYENAQTTLRNASISKGFSHNKQSASVSKSGYIKNLLVENGAFVQAGQPLAILTKNNRLLLKAEVFQNNYDKIPLIYDAHFKTSSDGKIFTMKELNGKIVSVGKSADGSSPYIPMYFEINNIEGFVSGSVLEVFLLSKPKTALIIPKSAILEEQSVFYVYVQTEGEGFQKRELKLGQSDGQNTEVLSGISIGERVVTKGGYQIKLSQASGALPAHGHEH